jgi:ribosomal protein S18 acetylase RimI-like enzyme
VTEAEIVPLEAGRIDALRPLWLELHHHHRALSPLDLVGDDELSWQRRRSMYQRLLEEDAFACLAEVDGAPVGYAFVRLHAGPDDTFPLGERYAEVLTLAVNAAHRGQGLGGRLLDAVDAELDRRGVESVAIAVMMGNDDALRFYERRGLRAGEVYLYRFGR